MKWVDESDELIEFVFTTRSSAKTVVNVAAEKFWYRSGVLAEKVDFSM